MFAVKNLSNVKHVSPHNLLCYEFVYESLETINPSKSIIPFITMNKKILALSTNKLKKLVSYVVANNSQEMRIW